MSLDGTVVKRRVSVIILTACTGISLPLHAGQGVPIGPATRFESALDVNYLYTDNLYSTSTNQVEATAFTLAPTLGIHYAPSDGLYSIVYRGQLGEYDSSSEDDYLDNSLLVRGAFRTSAKHAFDLALSYRDDHDAYGSVRTAGRQRFNDVELDKWENLAATAKYIYGAQSARLNWFIRGFAVERDYTTNEFDTIFVGTGTRFLDRTTQGFGTGFTYKLTPRSKLLLDYESSRIEYDEPLPLPLDGDLEKWLLGLRWLATGKTTGEIWLGRFERDFDEAARGEGTGTSWLGRVTWSPKVYSRISLDTGQETLEAVLQGENFVDRQHVGVRWDHDWTSRFSGYVKYRYTNDTYVGTTREDDITEAGFGCRYELSSYYAVRFSYTQIERDNNVPNSLFDFDRDVISLSLNATF